MPRQPAIRYGCDAVGCSEHAFAIQPIPKANPFAAMMGAQAPKPLESLPEGYTLLAVKQLELVTELDEETGEAEDKAQTVEHALVACSPACALRLLKSVLGQPIAELRPYEDRESLNPDADINPASFASQEG